MYEAYRWTKESVKFHTVYCEGGLVLNIHNFVGGHLFPFASAGLELAQWDIVFN